MRIGDSPREPLFPGRKKVRSSSSSDATQSSNGTESRDETLADGCSSEMNELMARLRELPDVRDDVIAAVEERLKNGELLTPEAAEETARQILAQLSSQAAEV